MIGKNATATARRSPNYTIDTADAPDNSIQIPPDCTDIAVGQDGSVTYVDQTRQDVRSDAGYISLASFPNEAGLERLGGSLWQADVELRAPRHVGSPASAASARRSPASSRCRTSTWRPSSQT